MNYTSKQRVWSPKHAALVEVNGAVVEEGADEVPERKNDRQRRGFRNKKRD